jgi:hypothetical protein
MTTCSDVAEYDWLTGSEAGALLEELAGDNEPLHNAVERFRGRLSPARTHLLMEQIELRRRAAAKFTQAARMFFTRIGLEQATDEWVANYKASRFIGHGRVADLCCGVGGDLMALAVKGNAVGVDRDPVAAHFAAVNSGAFVHTADVDKFDLGGIDAWHIDPDRRPGGRRTTSLESCEPDLSVIERLLARVPQAAVKLAPACRVPGDWTERCELEWISRGRECRQLIAWHGNLATAPGQHRATILPADGSVAVRTIVNQPGVPIPIVNKTDRYIFDIDPAVLAAGLKGALAAEHELSALSDGPTYLTGPRAIADAALACFGVKDILPLRVRDLSRHLRAGGVGQLEIKKRGVEIDPEKLRRDLKLHGDNTATLLITRIAGRPSAIVARRLVS